MFFSIFCSGGHFVQWSRTILAILVEGDLRNICVRNYFETGPLDQEELSFNGFSILSCGSHFVQWSRTILATL